MAGALSMIEASIPALRRYAFVLLRSQQDADDLVHDTLLRALDRLHSYRGQDRIRPWLFAIMHNLFITQVRRSRIGVLADATREIPSETASPGNQEDSLRWREVEVALATLPEEQRAVILLVSVEDLSYAEVAAVLGVPIGTFMSRLARGRERLRRLTQEREQTRPCLRRVK
jgi:RNA polymerase sigma-70 factor, ECF subfamily